MDEEHYPPVGWQESTRSGYWRESGFITQNITHLLKWPESWLIIDRPILFVIILFILFILFTIYFNQLWL